MTKTSPAATGCRRSTSPRRRIRSSSAPGGESDLSLALEVPGHDFDREPCLREVVAEALADGDAAVLASGAADADRQVALHLFFVLRREVAHELDEPAIEVVVFRLLFEIRDDLRIEAGLRPQLFDKVRIRQEAHVEQQI